MQLANSPGNKSVDAIQSFLESHLNFQWDYRTDAHSPTAAKTPTATGSYTPQTGNEAISYTSNPKGGIFFEKRSRELSQIRAKPTDCGVVSGAGEQSRCWGDGSGAPKY